MTACVLCGRPIPLLTRRPRCVCGGLPALPEPPPFDPLANSERRVVGAARFRGALGLPSTGRPAVTLGEAAAALQPLAIDGAPPGAFLLRADLEPSGSSSATGAALLADALSGAGRSVLHVDDAFDHALALARYVDGGRLVVTTTLARDGSLGRRALLSRAGARLVDRSPPGTGWIDAHPARQPLAGLGGAIHAFRVVEQLGRMPGSVVAPAAHGTLLAGLSAGFSSIVRAGIGPMPRMHGVQPACCAPLAEAFTRGLGHAPAPGEGPRGVGLAAGRAEAAPERDVEALDAALGSGGSIERVDDACLERAVRLLWRADVKVEPWAALPVAWSTSPAGRARLADSAPAVLVTAASGVRDGVPLFDPFP